MPELARNQFGVTHLRGEAEQRRGDLRVEQRSGHRAARVEQDLDVLARRVQDFQSRTVEQQLVQRRQVEAGQRVDQPAVGFGGNLHEAELRVVGALPHELGVEREALRTVQPEQGRLECGRLVDQSCIAHRTGDLRVESPFLRPPRQPVLQFLKVFLDIVLWRRGPQDLPASVLLLVLVTALYVAVSVVQLLMLHEVGGVWFVFVLLDPVLLLGGTWLLLRLFGHPERFLQTATAVLGTGALLGAIVYLPLQWLLDSAGATPESTLAGTAALALVVMFALVTGRILKLATDSSLFTGVAISLTYFLLINLLLGLAGGGGS